MVKVKGKYFKRKYELVCILLKCYAMIYFKFKLELNFRKVYKLLLHIYINYSYIFI